MARPRFIDPENGATRINVRVSLSVSEKLKAQAEKEGVPVGVITRRVLEEGLKDVARY
jgi:predicted DNA binding CopG/RHH family protein